MKKPWPLSQVLLLGSIVVVIVAVVFTIIITNTTLRSVEKNLPNTLIKELVSLDLVLEHLSEVVSMAEIAAANTTPQNFDRLTKKVQVASESIETLRQTYVFDNLVRASAFHAIAAPAIADLQIWLSEGISGYEPSSKITAQILLSRISTSFQKAKTLNRQSRLYAHNKLNEERDRLDQFLSNVNRLFMLTLLISIIMIFLFVRQYLLKIRESSAQKALQIHRDLLDSLFENILIGITVWSREGLFLFSNKYFTQLTGYSVENIKDIGEWFANAYPDPIYRGVVLKDWEKSTKLIDAVREFKVTCKNGQVKNIEFRGTFLSDGRALVTLSDITDRRLGEERLHYFKTAVEYSSDAIRMSDPTGRHWFLNKAFDDLFGDIGQDSQGSMCVDGAIGSEIFKTIMAGGQWIGEVEMYGKDGKTLNILLRAYAIKDKDDKIIGLVGTHTDMTLQKNAEKALQESEQQYRAVVENTPDLLYRTDTNGIIIFVSSSVLRLSGYSVEEAVGMNMAQEVYAFPEDRQVFLKKLKKHGFIKNFEARLKRKDGSLWWASTNAHFSKDVDGNIVGVEGITRDITDTKKAEEALRESEQQMRAILEASPDPMVMYNKVGHPQYINPSFTKVFGWTLDDLRGDLIPFVPEDQKKLTAKKIKEIYTQRKPLRFETKRYTKDRRPLDIILSASVTKGNDEEPTGLVVNLTDITERKILESQYEQAQKMESLGTLAGGIAHDFNNLLSGIFGYLDLARKKTTEPKIAEYLTKAFNISDRAKGLTHQLLTFSKGGVPVKKIESLVPFLQETTHFALSGANVSCSFDLPDDLWMCDYDKNQIGQVIDNIIINAHHAMPSGGNIQVVATNIIVTQKEHSRLVPGKYVKISISDKGTGIPEKYISRIFDPFFTTKQKGSGLGLATSYSIVKRHGGIIDVESEPGVGSTFHTFIPAANNHKNKEKTVAEDNYQGSGRILIMDDEEMIQEMLTAMIETIGFSATSTSHGREAVDAFKKATRRNKPFHAVILDLTVPGGLGGKETVKELRKIDKNIPVFVASGYSKDAAIANPEEFGFTASIQKPFTIEQLAGMFGKYLRK